MPSNGTPSLFAQEFLDDKTIQLGAWPWRSWRSRVWPPARPPPRRQLAMEPLKDSGSNIYPAFEGWYQNSDGTYTLLIGYYNRNKKQVLDIPIGPENRIEPGGPDQGQPTHFMVGRGWGTIAIKVPKDFGDKKLTWTLTANGKTVSVPFGITKGYQIEPFLDAAMGNKPPVIKFS